MNLLSLGYTVEGSQQILTNSRGILTTDAELVS